MGLKNVLPILMNVKKFEMKLCDLVESEQTDNPLTLPNLRELSLMQVSGLDFINGDFRNLKTIKLNRCDNISNDDFIKFCRRTPSIASISIENCPIISSEIFFQLYKFEYFENFQFKTNATNSSSITASDGQLENSFELDLNPNIVANIICKMGNAFPAIETLKLIHRPFTKEVFENILKLEYLKSVTLLGESIESK